MTWSPPKEKHTVVADAFDHGVMDELIADAPVVNGYRERLADDFPYADELTRDLGSLLFKPGPVVREQSDVDPRVVAARALVQAAWGVPEMGDLRQYTVYDRWATATALGVIADALEPLLEEVKQRTEDAQKAADRADDAQQRLESGDPSAEGDLQAAMLDLEELGVDADGIRATAAALTRGVVQRTAEDLKGQAEVAAGWGVEPGELQRMSFEERQELARRFDGSRIKDYLKLVGRMRFEFASCQARKTDDGRDEAYSVTLTGDLGEVLPGEMAALLDPATELEALLRLAEGRMLGRKWRGEQKSGRGPIVTVIDNSGSMAGAPEAYAKAIAIAMMDAAREDDRPYATIQFSTVTSTVVGCDWRAAIQVGEEFLNGGTDYHLALDEALTFIEQQAGYERADIVLIGDGDFSISGAWLKRYQERRAQSGVRVWGVVVGGYSDRVFHQTCDNVRHITDLTDPGQMTDLFQAV